MRQSTDPNAPRTTGLLALDSVLLRYLPFLSIVAALLLLLMLAPVEDDAPDFNSFSAGPGLTAPGSQGTDPSTFLPEGEQAQQGAASGTPGRDPGPAAGAARPSEGAPGATGQLVDALGRPLEGDRSRCAPNGLLQDNVTMLSPPCIPELEGPNPGATWRGVSAEEVVILAFRQKTSDEEQQAMGGAGLGRTRAQHENALAATERFVNKHYNFYHRRLKFIIYEMDCVDAACRRAAVKEAVNKHKPFMATWWGAPWEAADELARLGVPVNGPMYLDDEFYIGRRPYVYDLYASGGTLASAGTDYYCKKLQGKPVAYTSDVTMRGKPRRPAIMVTADAARDRSAELYARLLRECGADPIVYRVQVGDTAETQTQMTNIAASMKQNGVTTVIHPWTGTSLYLTIALDQQNYYPEHMVGGDGQNTHDVVGRLNTPSQWQYAFGAGDRPKERAIEDQDDYRAFKDVGYEWESYLTIADWLWGQLTAMQIQWAGPNLTPFTLEQGTLTSPQMGGYSYLKGTAWDGWECCNPNLTMWGFGLGSRYTAQYDFKTVYWCATCTSEIDGKSGAWVCLEDCKRFPPGGMNAAPPRPEGL